MVGLLIISSINIFICLHVIPKFEQIYTEALPGQILPLLTQFILQGRIPLILVDLLWLVAGIISVRGKGLIVYLPEIGILFNCLQIALTILGLFIPMVGEVTGMSNTAP